MKKIFGKNQVIISALAIMIAVAGYLSITQDKAQKTANITNDGESAQNDAIYDISDEGTYNSDSYELTDTGDIIQKALATNSPSDASTPSLFRDRPRMMQKKNRLKARRMQLRRRIFPKPPKMLERRFWFQVQLAQNILTRQNCRENRPVPKTKKY